MAVFARPGCCNHVLTLGHLVQWLNDDGEEMKNLMKFMSLGRPKGPAISLTADELKTIIADAVKQATEQTNSGRTKIDMNDLFTQLQRPPANMALRHFLTWENRHCEMLKERSRRAAQQTYDFIDREMSHALFNLDQFAVIESKAKEIAAAGQHFLDLGVYKGGSTRRLAKTFPSATIHGFDSFEGLPEDWSHVMKGQFGDVKGQLPDMPDNVKLYKGWFEDTLPPWSAANPEGSIALLRVDCDIYSSTKTIFDVLGPRLQKGTWICFDELIGYYGFQEHEHKAFMEFIVKTGFSFEYIAYGLTYTIARLK